MRRLLVILPILISCFSTTAQTIVASGPISFCQGDSVVLSVSGAAGNSTFQWTLNGADIANATGNSLKIFDAGTYNVIYTLGNSSQTLNDVNISIYSKPVGSFTFNPNNSCAKTPVQFINTSTGSGLTYNWDFGDPASGSNNTSTLINPVHLFIGNSGNGTQSFTVTLIVTSVNGCKDTVTSTVTIKQKPDTQLSGTGVTTYNGLPYFKMCTSSPSAVFTFMNLSSTSGTNTNYKIVWGDNTSDYNQSTFPASITHTYNTGTYKLYFIVTGNNSCVDTGTYYVFAGSNPAVGLNNPGNTNICSGSSLTFPITGTASNPPGTNYTVTFNDGSSPIVFIHPPPDSVTHNFILSSCGTSSLGYSNSFSATINASNPCGSSSGFIVPIYVSGKPKTAFSIAPKDTVCINTIVTVTNNGNNGNSIDNGVCIQGKPIWTITPSTGWSLISGSLGSTLGLDDPFSWQTGTNILQLNFTSPGVYSIKLKAAANSFCGSDSIIRTICVNPLPIAAFNVDNLTGCSPLIITTTNTSPPPNCGQNKYDWTVSYSSTAGCLPNTSGYTYINGTNSSSATPQFQFTNPGVYTISLRAISPAGSCSSLVLSKQITVKGKPVVNMNFNSSICVGQSVSPTATSSCNLTNATFVWSFPGGIPSSSNTLNPGSITYNTAGIYDISLTITNECGSTTITNPITIKAAPATPTADNNGPICSGTTLTLTSSTSTPGVGYSWTGPGGFTSTLQNPTRPGSTTLMMGSYTVTVSLNGCTSSSSTSVVINQTPANPLATSPINYCQNATALPLSATANAGNTLNWYTVSVGGVASSTAPTPNTLTTGSTTYYVSQVSPTTPACESGRVPVIVNVYAVPVITGNYTDPTTCTSSNGTITLTGLTPNTTYTIQYVKNNGTPSSITLTANANGVITINNLSSGIYSDITATLNGCSSNPAGPFTLVNPSAPAAPTVSNNGPLCTGSTLSLMATSSQGATYQWTGPGGFTSSSQNPIRSNVTTTMSGIYSVIVTLNGCASTPANTSVTVIQTPSPPVAISPVNYCQNANATALTASGSAGNTLNWYNVATGGIASAIAPTPNTTSLGSSTYYVSQVTPAPGCESGRTPVVVNVYAVPAIAGNYSDPTSCLLSNGTITLSGLIANTVYSVQYSKNGSSPTIVSIASNSSGVIIIPNLSVGNYSSITATLNGCSSNSVGPFTLVNPATPAAPLTGNNGPICSGSTLTLTAASSIPGVSYNWTGPGGFTSTSQNPNRPNAAATMSGIYSVTITSNGCTSVPATSNVTVIQTPTAPLVASPVNYCQNSSALPLNATGDPGNSFNWYNAATGGIVSTTPPVPNTSILGTTIYYVSQFTNTNPACESGRTPITVNVYAVPNINASHTDPTNCLISNGTITLTGLNPNTAYNILYTKNGTSPTIASYISNASGVIIISNLGVGTYTNITTSLNGCPSNTVGPFTLVNPTAPASPAAGNNGPICSGNTLNLTSTSNTIGGTYLWTGPGGFTSNLQNPILTNSAAAMSGLYTVTVTINGCTSSPATTNVLVNQTPTSPQVTSPLNYCQNATAMPLTATGSSGNTLNWYTSPTGGIASTTSPTPNTSNLGSTTYYVSQINTTNGCESGRAAITVNTYAIPNIGVSSTPPTTCSSTNGTITLTGLTANATYNVQYTVNGVNISSTFIANPNGNIIITNIPAGTYNNLSASFNGCPSNTVGPFTLVNPGVPSTPTANSNSPVCIGSTLNLAANSTTPGVSYNWTGPGGFTSSLQNPTISNVTSSASGRYYVTVRSNNCISEKDSVDVIINGKPVISLGPDLTLPPNSQHLMTNSIQNGPIVQYTWTPSTNLSCTNCPNPTATIQSNITYSLRVTNSNGCTGSDTINIKVVCEKSQIFIPNAFSPDGDGINDLLIIRSPGIVTVQYFRIFNRWGELIFEKNNFPTNDFSYAWDGKIRGVYSPADVFVYTAEVTCENGTSFTYKGNISVLR